jgi:hypothetical protein
MGFRFTETMAGSYRLLEGDRDERPMAFTIVARAPALRRLLQRPCVEIEGALDAEDLADHRPARGTMGLDVLRTGLIRYELDFEANDGGRYRFSGAKRVRVARLLETMTTLPARILDATGAAVATAELRFDARGDLLRFLRSWRLTRDS